MSDASTVSITYFEREGHASRSVVERERNYSRTVDSAGGGTITLSSHALDDDVPIDAVVDAIEDQCDALAGELVAAVRAARGEA